MALRLNIEWFSYFNKDNFLPPFTDKFLDQVSLAS